MFLQEPRCVTPQPLRAKALRTSGARRFELQTSSLSVLHKYRNYLPIKHLANASDALFRIKRTDSVQDSVQGQPDSASPLAPAAARHRPSIYADSGARKRGVSISPLGFTLSFGLATAWPKSAERGARPNSSSRPDFRPLPLGRRVSGVRRLICVFSASSRPPRIIFPLSSIAQPFASPSISAHVLRILVAEPFALYQEEQPLY